MIENYLMKLASFILNGRGNWVENDTLPMKWLHQHFKSAARCRFQGIFFRRSYDSADLNDFSRNGRLNFFQNENRNIRGIKSKSV